MLEDFRVMENQRCEERIAGGNGLRMSGILTGSEIQKYKLIVPGKKTPPDSLKPTTFDLTLGEGHYIYDKEKQDGEHQWRLVFIGETQKMEELNKKGTEIDKYSLQDKNKIHSLTIPAYGSALIQLNETVDTFTVAEEQKILVVGRFDLKLGNVHKGLISQQATQVEPYYKGKLFCFLYNLSNKEIILEYGQKIATIEFSYVSCFYDICAHETYGEIIHKLRTMNSEKYGGNLFCEDNGISEVRYFRDKERLPDDCGFSGLKDRILDEIRTDKIVEYLTNSDRFIERLTKEIGKRLQN